LFSAFSFSHVRLLLVAFLLVEFSKENLDKMATFGNIKIDLLLQCLEVLLPGLEEKIAKGNVTQFKGHPTKCPAGKEEEFLANLFAYLLGGHAVAVSATELGGSPKSDRLMRNIAQTICNLSRRVRSDTRRILPEDARLELFKLLAKLWDKFPQLNVTPVQCDPIFHGSATMEHLPTFKSSLQTQVADYIKSGNFASMKVGEKQSIDDPINWSGPWHDTYDKLKRGECTDGSFVVLTSRQIPGWKKPAGSEQFTCIMGKIPRHSKQPTRPIQEVGGTLVISNGSLKMVFLPKSAPQKAEFAVITFWMYPDGTPAPGTWYLRTREEIKSHDLLNKSDEVVKAVLG
jgi:hypothetical protein